MKANLFLVISNKMDTNRKKSRNEDGLIRLGKKARESLGLGDEAAVELWPASSNTSDRINRSRILTIYEAYSNDLTTLKETGISDDDYLRAGFVTTRTFNYICKREDINVSKRSSIWLANSIEDTVIGGDPEFILIDKSDRVKFAGHIQGLGHNDMLGSDGPLVEIRPEPAIMVDDFVKNIGDILTSHENTKLIEDYRWVSGSYFQKEDTGGQERVWTIGGHIHIGTPLKLYNTALSIQGDNPTAALYGVFAVLKKILDELVAVPMMRVEGVENSIQRRRRGGYGTVSDLRVKRGRLEFRTLSGAWLSHPFLAKAVIGTTKAITHAFFSALDSSNKDRERLIHRNTYEQQNAWLQDSMNWSDLDSLKELDALSKWVVIGSALHDGDISFDKAYFVNLRRRLKRLPTYREHSKYIDKFLAIVKLPDEVLDKQSTDVRAGWTKNTKYILN